MDGYSTEVAARRAGVAPEDLSRLSSLGVLTGDATSGYTDADVRRVEVIGMLGRAGIDIEAVAALVGQGHLSFDFLERAGFNVFAPLSDTTFNELSIRTGIAVERLTVLRDVTGGKAAGPDDLVREDELEIVPLIAYQLEIGFRWPAVERALRVYGDSLRRIAEAEAEWWRSEVQHQIMVQGGTARDLADRSGEVSPRLSEASDRALRAIYHGQQRHVWMVNIVDGFATGLEHAGFQKREAIDPAMCFLDLTGYTALTQERGDVAAAAMAERLSRIVQRISVQHGGRPVKWLGDGVMFHFPNPASGSPAALEMVEALAEAGLPPAHVGLDCGPVVIQEGDFYGQTVNTAARIGDYARPGEVLVSRSVVGASIGAPVEFDEIGPVELKGLSGLIDLFAARAPG